VLREHAERAAVLVERVDDEPIVREHGLEHVGQRGEHAVPRHVVAQRDGDGSKRRPEIPDGMRIVRGH